MNYQEKVKEFQITGGEDLSKGITPLREVLLKEEIKELEEAINENDRVEILDALCDIKYVNDGTANYLDYNNIDSISDVIYESALLDNIYVDVNKVIEVMSSRHIINVKAINNDLIRLIVEFNFPLETFEEALNRVHESNMSKFCTTPEETIDSIVSYINKGIEVYSKQNGDKWVLYRASDNKILKSINYKPVDLTDLI